MTEQIAEPTLEEILSPIIGNQRKFLLFRIADIDAAQARVLCNVKTSEYNHWFDNTDENQDFIRINRQRVALTKHYKKEAIKLLRKSNQIAAILMEEKMIDVMTKELSSRCYDLIKTPIAKDVYSKLVTDLDVSAPPVNPWQARLQAIIVNNNNQIPDQHITPEVINGQHIQANLGQTAECTEGELLSEGEQECPESEEEICSSEIA
jgi:hypothetical protein